MLPAPPLLLITDRHQARGDLAAIAAAACAGGCRWISLREKDLPPTEQLALFARLRAATAPFAPCLTLHGPPELAHAAGADGVHLPDGGDAVHARAVLGPNARVGLSMHHAGAAVPLGVDYITASPVFLSASKPGYGPALGVEGLRAFTHVAPVPVIALGGIEPAHAALCRQAGASGLAAMGGVMRAADPAAAVLAVLAAWSAGVPLAAPNTPLAGC